MLCGARVDIALRGVIDAGPGYVRREGRREHRALQHADQINNDKQFVETRCARETFPKVRSSRRCVSASVHRGVVLLGVPSSLTVLTLHELREQENVHRAVGQARHH